MGNHFTISLNNDQESSLDRFFEFFLIVFDDQQVLAAQHLATLNRNQINSTPILSRCAAFSGTTA